MSKQQLIKSPHIWILLTVLLAFGLWAIAGRAGIARQGQNSNPPAPQANNNNSTRS